MMKGCYKFIFRFTMVARYHGYRLTFFNLQANFLQSLHCTKWFI